MPRGSADFFFLRTSCSCCALSQGEREREREQIGPLTAPQPGLSPCRLENTCPLLDGNALWKEPFTVVASFDLVSGSLDCKSEDTTLMTVAIKKTPALTLDPFFPSDG